MLGHITEMMRQEALAKFITTTASMGFDLKRLCDTRRHTSTITPDINPHAVRGLDLAIEYLEEKILKEYVSCFRLLPEEHRPEKFLGRNQPQRRSYRTYDGSEVKKIYYHFDLNPTNATHKIAVSKLLIGPFYTHDISRAIPEFSRYLAVEWNQSDWAFFEIGKEEA